MGKGFYSENFWLAEPLSILLQTVLTKTFASEDAQADIGSEHVLQYINLISRSETLEEAWQQRSFYEFLTGDGQGEEGAPKSCHDLFVSVFRSNRHLSPAAIDFESYFPAALEQVNIPPVPIPILPVSYRFKPGDPVADEVTVVSWIPGLELEVRAQHWDALISPDRQSGNRASHNAKEVASRDSRNDDCPWRKDLV
jgi:hypothetical protein